MGYPGVGKGVSAASSGWKMEAVLLSLPGVGNRVYSTHTLSGSAVYDCDR